MRLTLNAYCVLFFFLHLENGSFFGNSNRNENQRTDKTPTKPLVSNGVMKKICKIMALNKIQIRIV